MRARRDRHGPLYAAVLVLSIAATVALTRATTPGSAASHGQQAVEMVDGVPVGTERTPAGALAAADNFLAVASQSVEQSPRGFSAVVAQAYEPASRDGALAEARRLRAHDTSNMSNYAAGGAGIAVIAARRLDSYTSGSATVTSWLGGMVWGPHLTPRQTWSLVDTTLRWSKDRWLIVSCEADSTPAPVPALVYVDGANDRAPAFGRLAGMSAPFYGTGG